MPPGTSSSIQGRSLIADNDQWNRPIILQNIPQAAIDGSYYDERALRNERYKLILRKFEQRPELRPGELYDLQQDPKESRNLYASESRRETVRQMARLLQAWGKERRDPLSVELGAWAADSSNSAR
jgi:arylsulfatase A-like enzyme